MAKLFDTNINYTNFVSNLVEKKLKLTINSQI